MTPFFALGYRLQSQVSLFQFDRLDDFYMGLTLFGELSSFGRPTQFLIETDGDRLTERYDLDGPFPSRDSVAVWRRLTSFEVFDKLSLEVPTGSRTSVL